VLFAVNSLRCLHAHVRNVSFESGALVVAMVATSGDAKGEPGDETDGEENGQKTMSHGDGFLSNRKWWARGGASAGVTAVVGPVGVVRAMMPPQTERTGAQPRPETLLLFGVEHVVNLASKLDELRFDLSPRPFSPLEPSAETCFVEAVLADDLSELWARFTMVLPEASEQSLRVREGGTNDLLLTRRSVEAPERNGTEIAAPRKMSPRTSQHDEPEEARSCNDESKHVSVLSFGAHPQADVPPRGARSFPAQSRGPKDRMAADC
jgi:hypothetical protein